MFYKLRLKLTLINATVIFMLFLLLIAGTYYFSHGEIIRRSDSMAKNIMTDIKSGLTSDLPSGRALPPGRKLPPGKDQPPPNDEPPGPSFFFVKISPNGIITFQSSNQSLQADELMKLTKAALQNAALQGVVIQGESEYRYLKSLMDNAPDTIILFQDFTREKNMLRIQLTALIVTGLICLILSFLGSFFMANRAMTPIQQAWQQQMDFLSDASHELRTPLTVIQTTLDVVLGNQEETVASQNKWLHNIREESAQMAILVDALLFLARADSNQQLLEKQLFSLNAAVVRAVSPFEAVAAAKGLTLSVLAKTPVTGCGDETRIKQVINILVDNAIRHTPAGGKVSVNLTRSDSTNLLTIADTGEGIAAEHLDKIFDRFYQIDKSRNSGGAGLGLAIAKCIVENHGGTIQVDSTPGFGTTFTLQLPWQ